MEKAEVMKQLRQVQAQIEGLIEYLDGKPNIPPKLTHGELMKRAWGSIDPHDIGGFDDVKPGDWCVYAVGKMSRPRRCILISAMQDGDAEVLWEDGTFDTVKWNYLTKERT